MRPRPGHWSPQWSTSPGHIGSGYLCWKTHTRKLSWWRHQMETFSALLAICAGNSPVPGEFPAQRPVTRSFDVFFDLRLNKRLSKQPWVWWFDTPSWSLWRHCNGYNHWNGNWRVGDHRQVATIMLMHPLRNVMACWVTSNGTVCLITCSG